MDKEKLVELAKGVAEKREAIVAAKELKLRSEGLMHESKEGLAFLAYSDQLEQTGAILVEAETALKSAILEVYEETSERKPLTGTEVKIFKSFKYDDAEALAWSKENSTGFLALNKKVFEKMGPEMGGPVEVIETAKCTLAKDLSSYLADPDFELAPPLEGGK